MEQIYPNIKPFSKSCFIFPKSNFTPRTEIFLGDYIEMPPEELKTGQYSLFVKKAQNSLLYINKFHSKTKIPHIHARAFFGCQDVCREVWVWETGFEKRLGDWNIGASGF